MPFYIGWIPNYRGIIFPSESMTTIGREFMTKDMKGMVLTPDGDAVAIDICGRMMASLVPIDDNGLCRMELEGGFLPDCSIAKALWMGASSAFTDDSHFLGSFFMKVKEDGLPTGALYDLLLITFFKDFMELVQMSRFILDRA